MLVTLIQVAVCAGLGMMPLAAAAGSASRGSFGQVGGVPVEAIALENAHGLRATAITLGASLQAMLVPDRDGAMADITLGYPTVDDYLAKPQFFGATVGRVANRIARGRFVLDGRQYQTPVTDGPNALHGGTTGFDKRVWTVGEVVAGGTPSVTLTLVSADGDQGYPGTLTATASYTLDDNDTLRVEYRATTDAPTLVNISNHAYWNLAGEGSVTGAMGHVLTIPADTYTPVDAGSIPTGEIRPVRGTAFDFRVPTVIGARVRDARDEQIRIGRGYDHNWVLSRDVVADPRLVARVEDPESGRVLEVLSDQPGLQFYSGNFLNGMSWGKSGRIYREGDAIALEPQRFPDTPNHPAFGSIRLDPGQTYRTRIAFRFATTAQ